MPSKIKIQRPLSIPINKTKEIINKHIHQTLPGNLIKRFWTENNLNFEGLGLQGTIELTSSLIHVDFNLSPPLSFMKEKIEAKLTECLNEIEKSKEKDIQSALPEDLKDSIQKDFKGSYFVGPSISTSFYKNFGGLYYSKPAAVLFPRSIEDIISAVKIAYQHHTPLNTRGAAHSQSKIGISENGILLDMTQMNRIEPIDIADQSIWVEAGTRWCDVVSITSHEGLAPPVLTNNLEVTVGGTLSVAGVGTTSFKYGIQGDNVKELDVVTMEGKVYRCSQSENRDLFYGVLAGLGQIGIIARAKLVLCPIPKYIRTYNLLYDNLQNLLQDLFNAIHDDTFFALEAWASPSPQGIFYEAGTPYARWFFPFHVSIGFNDLKQAPPEKEILKKFKFFELQKIQDLPTIEYFFRLIPVFDIWKRLGTWNFIHPWVEAVLPEETAHACISTILSELHPGINLGGHVLIWGGRLSASHVPLFKCPETENLIGFGLLPAVPQELWGVMKEKLQNAHELLVNMGGKRYLSGFIDFKEEDWKRHYGESWQSLCDLKMRYDPQLLLNPGIMAFKC